MRGSSTRAGSGRSHDAALIEQRCAAVPSIGVRIRATAIPTRAIAADVHATRIAMRAVFPDRRETAGCWSETATDIREIAADRREMTADTQEIAARTEETASRSPRSAPRRREIAADGPAMNGATEEIRGTPTISGIPSTASCATATMETAKPSFHAS